MLEISPIPSFRLFYLSRLSTPNFAVPLLTKLDWPQLLAIR